MWIEMNKIKASSVHYLTCHKCLNIYYYNDLIIWHYTVFFYPWEKIKAYEGLITCTSLHIRILKERDMIEAVWLQNLKPYELHWMEGLNELKEVRVGARMKVKENVDLQVWDSEESKLEWFGQCRWDYSIWSSNPIFSESISHLPAALTAGTVQSKEALMANGQENFPGWKPETHCWHIRCSRRPFKMPLGNSSLPSPNIWGTENV